MHRRRLTILLPAAAIVLATSLGAGCSTVDNDVAARVNDNELSNDELTELMGVVGQPDPTTGIVDTTNGEAVRGSIQLWVQVEVVDAGLEAEGTPLTDAQTNEARSQLETQVPEFADLSDSTADTLVNYIAARTVVGAMTDPTGFVVEATSNADIFIDPRFGQFVPTDASVVALGLPPVTEPAS